MADATDVGRSMPVYAGAFHAPDALQTLLDLLRSDQEADRKRMVSLLTKRFYDVLREASRNRWYINESLS